MSEIGLYWKHQLHYTRLATDPLVEEWQAEIQRQIRAYGISLYSIRPMKEEEAT